MPHHRSFCTNYKKREEGKNEKFTSRTEHACAAFSSRVSGIVAAASQKDSRSSIANHQGGDTMNAKCNVCGWRRASCASGSCGQCCINGHQHSKHGYSTKLDPPSKQAIGMELEYDSEWNSCILPAFPNTIASRDGSLMSSSTEIKSVTTCCRASTRAGNIVIAATRLGAKVSRACGFHVHLDRRFLSTQQQDAFARWAYANQDFFFAAMPPSRRSNQFCKRIGEYPRTRLDLNSHYYWFSYSQHDTYEVRIHASTCNSDKAVAWVDYWHSALHHVATLDDTAKMMEFADSTPALALATGTIGNAYLAARKLHNGVIPSYSNEQEEV